MVIPIIGKRLSSFRLILLAFMGLILTGALLLMLPAAHAAGQGISFSDTLFTATSAVCVTGLVVKDTAQTWSFFGQAVILILIQIGGLGVILVAEFIAMISGRRISLLQRSMLQDTISAPQLGGLVRMTGFIFKGALIIELIGALFMLPSFFGRYGLSGIWMALFHSVSAFCNAGFDIMGTRTGAFSSLTGLSADPLVVLPICLLIILGGIGFFTWQDMAKHKLRIAEYRMQSKVVLSVSLLLIAGPALLFLFFEFHRLPLWERISLSLFQAVTPRTAGFNTASLPLLSGGSQMLMILLMLIGGSPGSAAGGMKTTTLAVLLSTAFSSFRRKKNVQLFGRRIEDDSIKNAATLLMLYLVLTLTGAWILSALEQLPLGDCIFETASAIGTVGLSLGITPSLGLVSRMVLIFFMFFGRVGGLTLMYAALENRCSEVSLRPVEKIAVG